MGGGREGEDADTRRAGLYLWKVSRCQQRLQSGLHNFLLRQIGYDVGCLVKEMQKKSFNNFPKLTFFLLRETLFRRASALSLSLLVLPWR